MNKLGQFSIYLCLGMALTLSPQIFANDSVSRYCKRDAKIHCDHVRPGNGRIGRCLMRKINRISVPCQAVVDTASHFIKKYAAKVCGRDARRYCKRVRPGSGRILSCLKHNYEQLSRSCGKVVTKLTGYTLKSLDDY